MDIRSRSVYKLSSTDTSFFRPVASAGALKVAFAAGPRLDNATSVVVMEYRRWRGEAFDPERGRLLDSWEGLRFDAGEKIWDLGVSADGRRATFIGGTGCEVDVFVADVNSKVVVNLGEAGVREFAPAISADGKKVLFLREAESKVKVQLVEFDPFFF